MKLPRYPQSLKELPQFCREVIDYLRASHINNIVNGTIKESPSGSTIVCGVGGSDGNKRGNNPERWHPWKCYTSGGNTIYVGDGRVHSYRDGTISLASVSMAGFGDWEGGDVTVTAATGVIYGSVAAAASLYPIVSYYVSSAGETDDIQITLLRTMPDPEGSMVVEFAESLPIDSAAIFLCSCEDYISFSDCCFHGIIDHFDRFRLLLNDIWNFHRTIAKSARLHIADLR